MNKKKLPVLSIFLEAVSLPGRHFCMLLKVGLPLIIFGGLFMVSNQFSYDGNNSFGFSMLEMLITITFYVSLVMGVVGCHRIFLMEPHVVLESRLFNWTGNEIKYAGWWTLIGICAVLIALPFMFLVIPFVSSLISNVIENRTVLFGLLGLINIPIYYFVSRWSLVLPSSAIDKHGKSLSWSWELSDGNSWRLTLLIGGLPFLLDTLFNLLPTYDSIIYSLVSGAIWLVVGVVEIGLLSLSYEFLVSSEDSKWEFEAEF